MRYSKSSIKKEIYNINIGIPQETREISNKQSYLTLKGTRKRKISKAQRYKRKEEKSQQT